jgi:malate dehydrogenase (oxaloacetate-decarboxylating)(NADP+)
VSKDDLASGLLFPALPAIREVSVKIATSVVKVAFERGLSSIPAPHDPEALVRAEVFEPEYKNYV